jgi:hypothetical protein
MTDQKAQTKAPEEKTVPLKEHLASVEKMKRLAHAHFPKIKIELTPGYKGDANNVAFEPRFSLEIVGGNPVALQALYLLATQWVAENGATLNDVLPAEQKP